MNTDSHDHGIRPWQLERYLLDELPPRELAEVRDALAASATLRERLADLRRSNEAVLGQHPPAAVAAGLRERLARAPRERSRPLRPLLAFATAGALVAVAAVFVHRQDAPPPPPPDVTRVKGVRPYLILYRKAGDVQQLAPGAMVRRSDLLQVAYQAAGRRYGVIVSIDGAGAVTRHLPTAGEAAPALQAGGPVPLAGSYELDDAPGFERFVLVTADAPFAVEDVIAAARRQPGPEARLDLPDAMDQFSLVLRKEPHR
jgi:hypothetical protein